jgi:NAD(P)-dependent dehydrogenase (short-subunit alcohol dehydrogenase family)
METGLGGKGALVTGASGGSGATRVRVFAAEGAAGLLLSLQNGNNAVLCAPGASVLPEVEQE